MKLTVVFLGVLLMVQPALVLAQPRTTAPVDLPASQPVLLELPRGTRLKTPQGVLQGYSINEFKVVLKIEASYRSWGLQIPPLRKMISDYKLLGISKSKQLKLLQNQVTVLKKDRDRLTGKWTEDNRLRHLCENKPNFGSWISWGVAAAMAATAAVLAGILIAKE